MTFALFVACGLTVAIALSLLASEPDRPPRPAPYVGRHRMTEPPLRARLALPARKLAAATARLTVQIGATVKLKTVAVLAAVFTAGAAAGALGLYRGLLASSAPKEVRPR